MTINYHAKTDLLYLRLRAKKQQVTNKKVMEDVVLDLREDDEIVGIEIMDAPRHVNLEQLINTNLL